MIDLINKGLDQEQTGGGRLTKLMKYNLLRSLNKPPLLPPR